jgi:hypothetical protein
MKLRELFEDLQQGQKLDPAQKPNPEEKEIPNTELKTIGVCYGRWNPPHKGHKAVWVAASKNPIWYVGTNKNTEGPKDPLPYEVKLQCMAAVWPSVASHVIPEQDLFVMASGIYEEYGENVHLKVYTDEEWLATGLQKYNGQMNVKHGGYKFSQIEHVKTERLARATDLRAAVRRGDRDAFYQDAGIRSDSVLELEGRSLPMFDVVAHYLRKYPEKVMKSKKDIETTEDAAGVGIITKQNSTADVNASTPGKNLRAFKLAEEMAALEKDLAESTQQKISKRHQQSTAGLNTYGDSERMSGDYTSYRLGIAVAGANGKDPIAIKAKSWIGKKKSAHPYTKEEQAMLKQAYKAVGASNNDLNSGDMKSKELDSTNKVSPVATPKKNKYGV